MMETAATPTSVDPSNRGPSTGEVRAVIDIGTNSVKLLVGRVSANRTVEPLFERGQQTRLGEGFFDTRHLQPAAIARTVEAIGEFVTVAERFAPTRVRMLATAAAREAVNATALLEAIRAAVGRTVEVISGVTEADLAFAGVATDPRHSDRPLLVTDVGGGSTEFILGAHGTRHFGRSFPLGAVRVFETLHPPENPTPADQDRARAWVRDFLRRHVADPLREQRAALRLDTLSWVGVGGSVAILARIALGLAEYDRDRIESAVLRAGDLTAMADQLWGLPLAERKKVLGLPPERADIILTGVTIYEGILRELALPELRVSTRGLRFAALLEDP